MVIDPFRGQLLSGGNRISLRVSKGFQIEIITGLFYSVKLPNQAPYQLGHTRILNYEKMLVMVKYVVRGILSQNYRTFKRGKGGNLGIK